MNRNADISKSTKELMLLFYTNDICVPPYHIPACFRKLADLRSEGVFFFFGIPSRNGA